MARPASGRGAGQQRQAIRLRAGRLARRLVRLAACTQAVGPPVCAQLRRAVERSQAPWPDRAGAAGNLGTHTPKGSLRVRELLDELRGQLVLVYTPTYGPEANRIEWFWRALRRAVTHAHTRETLPPLVEDADAWAHTISPTEILRQIGSPFADADPLDDHELSRAA